jgi:hypothetical protein
MLFTGVSLIAGINSIVGGIGLAAADCHDRESGGQRCLPVGIAAAVVLAAADRGASCHRDGVLEEQGSHIRVVRASAGRAPRPAGAARRPPGDQPTLRIQVRQEPPMASQATSSDAASSYQGESWTLD